VLLARRASVVFFLAPELFSVGEKLIRYGSSVTSQPYVRALIKQPFNSLLE
jgi:hypothetical protein